MNYEPLTPNWTIRVNDQRKNSRASFGNNQIQKIRASRGKKQNQYFISHNNDEITDSCSNIKANGTFVLILMRS